MKYIKPSWEKRQLSEWSKYLLGILAWGVLFGFCGILWGLVQPIIELFTAPNYGTAMAVVGLATAAMILAKHVDAHPELFDFASMKPFLKESLAFANPARSRVNLAEELDKHHVRHVYKEITGKNLPDDDLRYNRELKKKLEAAKKNEPYSKDGRAPAPKELLAVLQKPIESPHTKEELKQLQQGSTVDISDSWYLNRQKKSSHQYFHLTKKVIVDPVSGRIDFVLESEQFTDEKVRERESIYRLKQNLYEFLHAVHQQDWMQSYLQYVSLLSCTCCYSEDDGFGGQQVHPICRIELSRAHLRSYENKFFDVGTIKLETLV